MSGHTKDCAYSQEPEAHCGQESGANKEPAGVYI